MSKLQLQFMAYLELCQPMPLSEINETRYPRSMIDALISKGFVSVIDGDRLMSNAI